MEHNICIKNIFGKDVFTLILLFFFESGFLRLKYTHFWQWHNKQADNGHPPYLRRSSIAEIQSDQKTHHPCKFFITL